jgi:hypothetical protein
MRQVPVGLEADFVGEQKNHFAADGRRCTQKTFSIRFHLG